MFGLFKKRIPAPQHERALLVRRMFLERSRSDPKVAMMLRMTGTTPEELTPEMLMQGGAPELTVLRVVEQFFQMKDQGATTDFAVKTLNQMHAAALSIADEDLTQLRRAASLFEYVRHIIDTLHGHAGITDEFLIDAIQEVKSFYKR
jgi:hypothetical protein